MHTHRSPGLTAIYNATRERSDLRVLDLGSSSAGTFRFFSTNSGKIIFEDLRDFVTENSQLPETDFLSALKSYCLPKKSDEKFDIVLAWDFLNYLPFNNAAVLLNYISGWCKQDTLIFTIKYPGSTVPKHPPGFEIVDKHRVKVQKFSTTPRAHPSFTLSQFYKHTSGFQIENSISQQEGMLPGFTEQLMSFKPSSSQRNQLTTVAEMKPQNFKEQLKNSQKHFSPSISRLKTQDEHNTILDLGLKSRENLEVWRQTFKEVYFEDLTTQIKQQSTQPENIKSGLSPNTLNFSGKSFDVIMTWDLLNFCSQTQMEFIANRIREIAHENTVVSTLVYTGNQIPEKPAHFWLNEDDTLQVETLAHTRRTVPRLTITGLMKVFGGARMIGTYAFEDGMNNEIREFLFTVTPLPPAHANQSINANGSAPESPTSHRLGIAN